MSHVKLGLDLFAVTLGCVLIVILMEMIRVSGETNVQMIVLNSAGLIGGQVGAYLLLCRRVDLSKIYGISLATALGLLFWLITHIMIMVWHDRRYILQSPELSTVMQRYLEMTTEVLLLLAFFMVVILATVLTIRYVAGRAFRQAAN
ncbi:MAG: hypothetical protein R2682_00585 [Pyrinomonadaceae bacterium]